MFFQLSRLGFKIIALVSQCAICSLTNICTSSNAEFNQQNPIKIFGIQEDTNKMKNENDIYRSFLVYRENNEIYKQYVTIDDEIRKCLDECKLDCSSIPNIISELCKQKEIKILCKKIECTNFSVAFNFKMYGSDIDYYENSQEIYHFFTTMKSIMNEFTKDVKKIAMLFHIKQGIATIEVLSDNKITIYPIIHPTIKFKIINFKLSLKPTNEIIEIASFSYNGRNLLYEEVVKRFFDVNYYHIFVYMKYEIY